MLAYQNIYASQGNMTQGTDGKTIDAMSLSRIDGIIASLKDESYQPQPSRRTYIPKKNGKMRPLGIPSFDDKLVQECVRLLLEAIYEGSFAKTSHGFRPNHSCHTALNQIQVCFSGVKWFVEGDIKGFFDNIDHEVMIGILAERIKDDRFLRLIRKFLKAGYLEDWKYHNTYSGTPQGGIISPILANIYLDKLDRYMEELKTQFDKGAKRAVYSETYELEKKRGVLAKKLRNAITEDERQMLSEKIREIDRRKLTMPYSDPFDANYKRLQYVRYPNAGTPKVFICAMHPTNPECADLLTKKDSDLRKIIETRDIPCEDKTRNSAMRTAIWSYYGDDLQVNSVELDVTKGDAKPIWEKLQKYLPVYSLFQADRKNSDSDSEVQDPLHAAVKEILQDEDISQTLDHVAEIVEGKLQEVATRTLEKLREMSPDIANTLSPVIPPASSLKWADVFKSVTISGDESIPINKRGSGSKRLILLNFFRAEVERRKDEANAPGIIYAIEEPETSQHSENQKKLINALIALSTESNVQVIVTTHSAVLVNALDFKNIRLICADGSQKRVEAVRSGQLPFPSLNEVNYLAFSEISEGYHDELYGYLEEQGWLNEYKQGKTTVPYKKISANGTTREQQICMTEYIRHQIHHPENTYNARFNDSQLRRSIEDMRAFVTSKAQTPETT